MDIGIPFNLQVTLVLDLRFQYKYDDLFILDLDIDYEDLGHNPREVR